ncbi:MAG: hypothetical protein MZU91_01950 [Desulfosudis oleivorans]|nr:hypothetical protein [Desulfosudis oleivorans]
MIDGALGMAYGVSSNTFLLSRGHSARGGIGQRAHGGGGDDRHLGLFTLAAGQRRLGTGQAPAHPRRDRRAWQERTLLTHIRRRRHQALDLRLPAHHGWRDHLQGVQGCLAT